METEVPEIVDEALLEHLAAARRRKRSEIGKRIIVEHEVLDEVCNLAHAAGNGVAASERILAEEDIEACLGIGKSRLPESLSHRELIEIGVERDVSRLRPIGQRHKGRPPVLSA